jgi:hypothetical protein
VPIALHVNQLPPKFWDSGTFQGQLLGKMLSKTFKSSFADTKKSCEERIQHTTETSNV